MTFKVGDKVRCIDSHDLGPTKGEIYTVHRIRPSADSSHGGLIYLGDCGEWFADRFELVLDNSTTVPHKWQKEIIAWANGATIQYLRDPGVRDQWCDVAVPIWSTTSQYRIKPEKKPDCRVTAPVALLHMPTYTIPTCNNHQKENHNVAFVFDGETGQLKSVEMIK